MSIQSSIFDIEKNKNLTDLQLDNHWFYPVIKQIVINSPIANNVRTNSAIPSKSNYLKKIFIDFFYYYLKSKKKKKGDYLIFDFAQSRRIKVNNKSFSVYADPLMKLLPKSLIVENSRPFEPFFEMKIYSENIIYDDFAIDLAYIKAKWFKKTKDTESIYKVLEETGIVYSKDKLNKMILKFCLIEKHYEQLLKKYKPKGVFVICAYDYKRMALVGACKKLKIKTIEIQHGVVHNQNPGYIYKQLIDRYYIPDYFFVYGSPTKDLLLSESKLFLPNQIKITGSLFHEQYIKMGLNQINNHQVNNFIKNKKVILISSQYTVNQELRSFVQKLSKEISVDYCILYKPHHNEKDINSFYSCFLSSENVLLVNENILSLICLSHVHSTVYSTTAFEASFFNVPNIFIEVKPYTESISSLINQKENRLAKSINDYLMFLKEIQSVNSSYTDNNDSNEFYAKNSSQKTLSALAEIFVTIQSQDCN